MTEAGYRVQVFLLNAASMGVPQKRERVFFIGVRNDFDLPKLELRFNEKPIPFKVAALGFEDIQDENTTESAKKYWHLTAPGKSFSAASGGGFFNWIRIDQDGPCPTIASACHKLHHPYKCRPINDSEVIACGTYPLDYNFKDIEAKYLIGMSVPPVMTAQIAHQIWIQWLSKINGKTPE